MRERPVPPWDAPTRLQPIVPSATIPPPASAPPPPPPPPGGRPTPFSPRLDQEIGRLTDELLEALANYRAAKKAFLTRVAQLEHKHGPTAEADVAGRTDYRRARAVSDCTWWRGEVMAASNALIALRAVAGGGRL